jgi:DMSO/TMAO reductase YedYZ heme-binding membrane subunit
VREAFAEMSSHVPTCYYAVFCLRREHSSTFTFIHVFARVEVSRGSDAFMYLVLAAGASTSSALRGVGNRPRPRAECVYIHVVLPYLHVYLAYNHSL